jgi:hypothetical protein
MISPANAFSQLPWRSAASVIGLLIVWEATARAHLAPILFLPPVSMVQSFGGRSLTAPLRATFGIASAAFSGLPLGTIAGVISILMGAIGHRVAGRPLVGLGFVFRKSLSSRASFVGISLSNSARSQHLSSDYRDL